MLSWRLLGLGLIILLAGALVSLALSAPAAETPAALRQAQGAAIAATPIVREFAVVTNTASQLFPAISGNIVVWNDTRNGNWDIYGKNLTTGQGFAVVTNTAQQWHPAISGNIVVWTDGRHGNLDIYGKDLASGREFAVVTNTAYQGSPAISGNIVVWEDDRSSGSCYLYNCDIYGKDLTTGVEFPVATSLARERSPAISGNIVTWERYSSGSYCRAPRGLCDVYGKNLVTGEEFAISVALGNQAAPAISGNVVVWQDERNDPWSPDIYGARLEWSCPGVCTAGPVATAYISPSLPAGVSARGPRGATGGW